MTIATGSPAATEPRRLTPTERLQLADERMHEVTMASLTRRPSVPESAVTISRNAKGVAQFEVTVRGESVEACEAEAILVYERLVDLWPYPVANGGPE